MSDVGVSLSEREAELYDVVPERFIAARDDLVRRLRSEGDKAGATRVAKLRRPPVTTWALNQVARTDPSVIEAMLAAGGELRAAMERALDGDASGLRRAHSEDRAAMEAVVASAADRLAGAGYSVTDVIRQRMASTLRAAIVDSSVASDLTGGVLAGDRDAPGFGIDALSVPLSPPRPAKAAAPAADPARAPEDDRARAPEDDDEAAAAARRRQQERERQAEQAVSEARRLAEEAESARQEAEHLASEAQRREGEARTARQKASDAQRRANAARQAAAAAQAEADRLTAEAGA